MDRICHAVLLFAIVAGLLSCEDPSEVGLSLNSEGTQIDVLYEEISLPSTNVFIDSLRTDADRRLLVGQYNDPVFGNTSSSAFSQLALSSFTFQRKDDSLTTDGKQVFDYEIDSVILQLRYNYFHSNNFSQTQSIKVKQINDTLFNGVFYLSKFPAIVDEDSKLYGEKSFQVDPEVDTLLKINLDVFGEETLKFFRESSVGSISGDSIINQLRGIALIPESGNSAILGFDPAHADTKLSVYYQIKQIENVQQDSTILDSLSVNFNFVNAVRFNAISTDRSSSDLSIADENFESFDLDNGKVYLQSATGIYPKIDISPLKQFLADQGNIIINRCDIEIPAFFDIVHNEYISQVDNSRFFFIKDGGNVSNSTSRVILSNNGYLSNSSVPASAVPNEDESAYETEITLFTQLINADAIDVEKLLMVPSDITSMNQSVFEKSGIKLKVYYTIPN
ncbi:DUF4270 family protein [Reichenbachiella sp. MALMAid0571]|uniref:DUF4270 family protein n=1 Tax=Reichenbachiella sp. MALMAid0571 TaxID=3143939 RepID=UPI0032DFE892